MRVTRDGEVRVSAPLLMSDKKIKKFLNEHKSWLVKAYSKTVVKTKAEQKHSILPNKEYATGDKIYV